MREDKGASPRKMSGKKGQRQKGNLLCLNKRDNKSTDMRAHFCPHLFYFLGSLWPFWVWAKKCLIL